MRGLGSGHVTCGPMGGLEINFTGRGHIQTYIHTYGHSDSMTESAQWADSVKIGNFFETGASIMPKLAVFIFFKFMLKHDNFIAKGSALRQP